MKRIRQSVNGREKCLGFAQRVALIPTRNTEARARCVRELEPVAVEFDRALRVALNLTDALLDKDYRQAQCTVAVSGVMARKAEERLVRLMADVEALHAG